MSTVAQEVVAGAHCLARLGLVTAFGHVSVREGDSALITPARALADVSADSLVRVPLRSAELPAGAPAESWLHLAIYRSRSDVQAVSRAQPASSLTVGAVAEELLPFFGQMSWLGPRVGVLPGCRLLRSAELAAEAPPALGGSSALILRGNGAVTTGASVGDATARMWLLEQACRSYLDAGERPLRLLDADEQESWRRVERELLPRLWASLERKAAAPGEPAIG